MIATREEAAQFGLDFNWEDTSSPIDAAFAADEILSALDGEVAEDVVPALRAALIDSAAREELRRAE